MPRDAQNNYYVPQSWDEIEHPECGNQADWIYAIKGALTERFAIPWCESDKTWMPLGDSVIDSPMRFDFMQGVTDAIIHNLDSIRKYFHSNGSLAENKHDYWPYTTKNYGWLNPNCPLCCGVNSDDTKAPNIYADVQYNFLRTSDLLALSGCNFMEPLTEGYSSIQTCFPVWLERVKNAINQLHVTPVLVDFHCDTRYSDGWASLSSDGAGVDLSAYNNALSAYPDPEPLPAGDGTDASFYFDITENSYVVRRYDKNDFSWGTEYDYFSDYRLYGTAMYIKRLYDAGLPRLGCNVYAGYTSTYPSGYDEYRSYEFAGPTTLNQLETVNLGHVLSSDNLRYIHGQGWWKFIDGHHKYKVDYERPPMNEGYFDYGKGYRIRGKFYADWAVEDGFKFKA